MVSDVHQYLTVKRGTISEAERLVKTSQQGKVLI
jgi:hypothetical protein